MNLVGKALSRHAAVYMADRMYRISWLAFPLAITVFLITRLVMPASLRLPVASETSNHSEAIDHRSDLARQSKSLLDLYNQAKDSDLTAEAILRREANEGSSVAQTFMGYLNDPILNKAKANVSHTREAIDWYQRAALQHVTVAEINLGFLLSSTSFGLAPDYDEARYWLEKVAPVHLAALRMLGLFYREGKGVMTDLNKANGLLRMAAERGDVIAEIILAKSYETGADGLEKNPAEAIHLYRLAAMQNNAFAERKLAEHLETGDGAPVDAKESAQWYARAAAGGDAFAQTKVMRTDPTAAFRSPKWGAAPQTFIFPNGDDPPAERGRCLAQRMRNPLESMASTLPSSFDEQKRESERLVVESPRDPRVRYARASLLYDLGRSDVAKVDLECAIDDQATWLRYPAIQPYILALLARIDMEKGNKADAKATIASVCASKNVKIQTLDDDIGLCR